MTMSKTEQTYMTRELIPFTKGEVKALVLAARVLKNHALSPGALNNKDAYLSAKCDTTVDGLFDVLNCAAAYLHDKNADFVVNGWYSLIATGTEVEIPS